MEVKMTEYNNDDYAESIDEAFNKAEKELRDNALNFIIEQLDNEEDHEMLRSNPPIEIIEVERASISSNVYRDVTIVVAKVLLKNLDKKRISITAENYSSRDTFYNDLDIQIEDI
jgi:hypothetical protein